MRKVRNWVVSGMAALGASATRSGLTATGLEATGTGLERAKQYSAQVSIKTLHYNITHWVRRDPVGLDARLALDKITKHADGPMNGSKIATVLSGGDIEFVDIGETVTRDACVPDVAT